jgi:hypothetical protein
VVRVLEKNLRKELQRSQVERTVNRKIMRRVCNGWDDDGATLQRESILKGCETENSLGDFCFVADFGKETRRTRSKPEEDKRICLNHNKRLIN